MSIKDTDYLIVADNGVKENGQLKSFRVKAIKIQKHNNIEGAGHIPIVRESICKRCIELYQPSKP